MTTHVQKAHALQDDFEAATGIRPRYPRSRIALQDYRETLDRYIAAQDAAKALDAQRQAVKDEADELARLGQMEVDDDFDLDQPTTAGKLEGEPARLLKRAKGAHRQEGAAHVFSTWRQEDNDPFDLGDVRWNDKIRMIAGKIIQDNTMTAEMAAGVLQHLEGDYLVKVKVRVEAN